MCFCTVYILPGILLTVRGEALRKKKQPCACLISCCCLTLVFAAVFINETNEAKTPFPLPSSRRLSSSPFSSRFVYSRIPLSPFSLTCSPPPRLFCPVPNFLYYPPLLFSLLLCSPPLFSRVVLWSILSSHPPLFSSSRLFSSRISLHLWCPQAENEKAGLGAAGCTFWQYNPAETYQTTGLTSEDSIPLEPGRVRFENQGMVRNTTVRTVKKKSTLLLDLDLLVFLNVYSIFCSFLESAVSLSFTRYF